MSGLNALFWNLKAQIKKGSIIVRALGHLEQEAVSGTSLDILCKKLAENLEAQYTPPPLTKTTPTTKMAWLKRHEKGGSAFQSIFILRK